MTSLPPLIKTLEEIKELPTASKLRLAADILESVERGEFKGSVESAFGIARSLTTLAGRELAVRK